MSKKTKGANLNLKILYDLKMLSIVWQCWVARYLFCCERNKNKKPKKPFPLLSGERDFQFFFLEVGNDLHPIWIEFCFWAALFLHIISPTHIFLIIYLIPWHHFFPPDIMIILFSLAHCHGHTFSLPNTGITITRWLSTKQLWKGQTKFTIFSCPWNT